jgi:hypothetical protein
MKAEVSVEEQNKLTVQRFYEEVLDEIISRDYIDYGYNSPRSRYRRRQTRLSWHQQNI